MGGASAGGQALIGVEGPRSGVGRGGGEARGGEAKVGGGGEGVVLGAMGKVWMLPVHESSGWRALGLTLGTKTRGH